MLDVELEIGVALLLNMVQNHAVDGFDIQPEMVELAKQATSHLDMVHIQVGNVADMPYDDDSFDVAISLFHSATGSIYGYIQNSHFQTYTENIQTNTETEQDGRPYTGV